MASTSQESITTAATSPSKCYLLDLPPELRNCIYRLTLAFDAPIKVITHHGVHEHGPRDDKRSWTGLEVPVLQTCRQIRAEATLMYYSTNTFEFSPESGPFRFDSYTHTNNFGALSDKMHLLARFQISTNKGGYTVDLTQNPTLEFTRAGPRTLLCRDCERGLFHFGRCLRERHKNAMAKVRRILDTANAGRATWADLTSRKMGEIFDRLE